MKLVYLSKGSPSETFRTRPALTGDPWSGDQTSSKVKALKVLWASRKTTPRWQRPGIGQFTRCESVRTALDVIFA